MLNFSSGTASGSTIQRFPLCFIESAAVPAFQKGLMMKNFFALLASIFITSIALAGPLELRTAQPVMTPSVAYATGEVVGSKLSLTSANTAAPATSGIIRSVVLTDLAAQTGNVDIVFFSADPSATTFTDNAAFTPADADLVKIIGSISMTDSDAYADNSIMQRALTTTTSAVELPFVVTSGSTLYAAIVARAARTQATSADLTLKVYIESK